MKKILISLIFLLAFFTSFSQPIINRTFGTNTVNDPRLMASLNLYLPRYVDTTTANGQVGIDTCGAAIFVYADMSVYYRNCSPKRWSKIASLSEIQTLLNLKVNISDTLGMLTPYIRGSGTANRIPYWRDSRTLIDESQFTYNPVTNILSVDTVKSQTLQADDHLLMPLKDTLAAAIRKGEIRYDPNANSIVYNDGIWKFLQSIVGNRPNIQLAAGVVRGTYNSGTGVTDWNFILNGTHDSLFFNGINTNTSQLHILYPNTAQVITFVAVPDEQLAPWLEMGASVGTSEAIISLWQKRGTQGGQIRGNANDTFSLDATRMTGWNIDYTQATGVILLSPSITSGFWEQTAIQANYVGTNAGFHLEKLFSGLSGFAWGFQLVDAFGNAVTDPVTPADVIQIDTSIPWHTLLSPGGGGAVQQSLFSGFTNIWLFAIYKRLP